MVKLLAAVLWSSLAAVATFPLQHVAPWSTRSCFKTFIDCCVYPGWLWYPVSRAHAERSGVLGGVCAPPKAGPLNAPPSAWQLIYNCKLHFTIVKDFKRLTIINKVPISYIFDHQKSQLSRTSSATLTQLQLNPVNLIL